jgi:hypothetical protein
MMVTQQFPHPCNFSMELKDEVQTKGEKVVKGANLLQNEMWPFLLTSILRHLLQLGNETIC